MKNILSILFLFVSTFIMAQVDPNTLALAGGEQASSFTNVSLAEIAILDIAYETNKDIDLSFAGGVIEAGSFITGASSATDNTLWLNYSSAIRVGQTNNISASIINAPSGIEIKLLASNAIGTGAGQLGTPTPEIILIATDQVIITGIGGAYTGDGFGNGHNLTYSATITDPTLVQPGANVATITFTMTNF